MSKYDCHREIPIAPMMNAFYFSVSLKSTENGGIDDYHIFTSCDPCTPGISNTGNCSVDISLQISGLDVGKVRRFCVVLDLVKYVLNLYRLLAYQMYLYFTPFYNAFPFLSVFFSCYCVASTSSCDI